MPKLWSGRFSKTTSKIVERFTSSIDVDFYLLEADIKASKAHLNALKKANIVNRTEAAKLNKALDDILKKHKRGEFQLKQELEDIHMNIETALIEACGDVGKKIHTGRSRNDQVVTAFKLTILKKTDHIYKQLIDLLEVFVAQAEKTQDTIIPGYTHLQRAQPILMAHYFLAMFEMFYRDAEKLLFYKNYLLEMPLGSGALAGNAFNLDRFGMASELELKKPTHNSLDSISDRDYALDVLHSLSLIMLHFSRLSEDLILWSSEEFAFITLSDAFTTGSSIMPQKKNPDVSELTRGKSGRVLGDYVSLFTTLKGLPMGYNRDLQEDKQAVFDALDTVEQVLDVNIGQLKSIAINEGAILESLEQGYIQATDLAEYLVKKGVAFREAHTVIGQLVRYAIDKQLPLSKVTLIDLKKFSSHFDQDALQCVQIEYCLNSRDSYGGTARKSVKEQLKIAKKRLKATQTE